MIFLAATSFVSAAENKDPAKKPAVAAAQENEEQQAEEKQKFEITVTAPRVEIPLKQNPAATTVVETPILQTSHGPSPSTRP